MLIHLYKSMVHPILNYGNILWGPLHLMDQSKVEAIQQRETKLFTSLHDNDCGTRLVELRLPSFNYHSQRGNMVLLCQIFNNLLDFNANDFFVWSSGITRGHKLKFYKCHSSRLLQSNFFSHRVVNV